MVNIRYKACSVVPDVFTCTYVSIIVNVVDDEDI